MAESSATTSTATAMIHSKETARVSIHEVLKPYPAFLQAVPGIHVNLQLPDAHSVVFIDVPTPGMRSRTVGLNAGFLVKFVEDHVNCAACVDTIKAPSTCSLSTALISNIEPRRLVLPKMKIYRTNLQLRSRHGKLCANAAYVQQNV